jgi:hypothetical protein
MRSIMKTTILTVSLALGVAVAARAETADPYRTAYTASLSDRLPLLVFVGQPARDVSGARSITVPTFPEAAGPCVVVGVVRGTEMVRQDLNGSPATTDIQTAVASLSAPVTVTSRYESGSAEALDEVNAARAARGLRPFARDPYLTAAAAACAQYRAAGLIAGHTSNDFAFVPAGGYATSAGCAAWEPGFGWGSCCTYDGYTYGGAAYATGRDGRRYMHLFVR